MVQAPARPLPARHAMEIDAQPRLADDRRKRASLACGALVAALLGGG